MSLDLRSALGMVESFHERMRVSAVNDPETWSPDPELESIGRELLEISLRLQRRVNECTRWLRAHLAIEEAAESIIAMAQADPVGVLDATADKQYVLLGDAASFELPLEEAFIEVHRSNMTKEKQPDDPHAARVRSKGPNYQPPRLKEVYWLHRRLRQNDSREVVAAALDVDPEVIKQFEYIYASSGDPMSPLDAYTQAQQRVTNRSTANHEV